MYSDWPIVLRIISEGVTAACGLLGSLTDFRNKDDHRVSWSGRLALVGIVFGFVASAILTVVEQRDHAEEILRLSNPLASDMEITLVYTVDGGGSQVFNELKSYLSHLPYNEETDFPRISQAKLPKKFKDPYKGIEGPVEVLLFKTYAMPCKEAAASKPNPPDLSFIEKKHPHVESASEWRYWPGADRVEFTRASELEIGSTSLFLTSVPQLQGATMIVLAPIAKPGYKLANVYLTVANGLTLGATGLVETRTSTQYLLGNGQTAYCYEIPQRSKEGATDQ